MVTRSTTATCLSHSAVRHRRDDVGGDDGDRLPAAGGGGHEARRRRAAPCRRPRPCATGTLPAATAEALRRVQPVGLDVEGVVPEVDAAGGQAEGDEREQRLRRARGQSSSTPAAPGAANTSRFFAHCSGRAVRSRPPANDAPAAGTTASAPATSSTITSPTPRGRRRRASPRRRPSRRRPTARPRPDRRGGRRARRGAVRPWRHRGSFPHRGARAPSVAVDAQLGGDHPSGREAEVLGERAQVDGERRRHEDDVVAARGVATERGQRVRTQPPVDDPRGEGAARLLDARRSAAP